MELLVGQPFVWVVTSLLVATVSLAYVWLFLYMLNENKCDSNLTLQSTTFVGCKETSGLQGPLVQCFHTPVSLLATTQFPCECSDL